MGNGRNTTIGGEVTCTNTQVVIKSPSSDTSVTVTRDGQVTVAAEGQTMQPVQNSGQWTPQAVQIDAKGLSVWTDDEGDIHPAVSVEGTVLCGVPPAPPTTTTGY
ncbi:hypothetical protein CFN78_25595 [Amycolatopsis antarctica]|uniref:Uncharacterized protein n=1 Tax=Amycolatopsis antarctica TaxID=1854586 RepID=A0A263CY98_9PSEU|nr:hypothetical protein CFN78_25595 [Amycolatopsis antarctica]